MATLFKPRSVVTKKPSSASAVATSSTSTSLNSAADKEIKNKAESPGNNDGVRYFVSYCVCLYTNKAQVAVVNVTIIRLQLWLLRWTTLPNLG